MIVFVGMPGTGKTSFYSKDLQPRGFIHINQDILKTKAKVLKTIKTTCQQGLSMVIDATNPQQEKRQEYYNLAQQYSYTVIVLYFVGDGHGWNKLRTKVVPTIAYSMYYKNLVEPSLNNTPGEVYQLI
jgi:bifunctional polynucleotide phosphatase/kinase